MSVDWMPRDDVPDRWVTMSSSANPGNCTISNRTKRSTTVPRSVRPDLGSQPPKRTYLNRPDHSVAADIRGAQPRKLHRAFGNKPCRIYDNSDIDGSKTTASFLTKRRTNPLNPEYVLPSFKAVVVPPVKFMGDRFDVSDIEGAKPREPRTLGRGTQQRDTMDASDIEGAQAGWKPQAARKVAAGPARDTMKTTDVTSTFNGDKIRCLENAATQSFGGRFNSNRRFNPSDPNSPVYKIDGRIIRDSPKSKPPPVKQQRAIVYSGTTKGIDGSTTNWKPEWMPERKLFRNPNNNQDIKGSTPNKRLHRTIFTNRELEPLNPVYIGLEGQPLGTVQRPITPTEPVVRIDARIAAAARREAKRLEVEQVAAKIARLEAAARPVHMPELKPNRHSGARPSRAKTSKPKPVAKSVPAYTGPISFTGDNEPFLYAGADDPNHQRGSDGHGVTAEKNLTGHESADTAGNLGPGLVPTSGGAHERQPNEFDGMLTKSSLGSGFMTKGAADFGITAIRTETDHDGKDTAGNMDYSGMVPSAQLGRKEESSVVAAKRDAARRQKINAEIARIEALMPVHAGAEVGNTHTDSLGPGLIPTTNAVTGVDRVVSDDLSRGVKFQRGSGPIIADYVAPTKEERAAAEAAFMHAGSDTASSLGIGMMPANSPDYGINRVKNADPNAADVHAKLNLAYGSMVPRVGASMDEGGDSETAEFSGKHSESHFSQGMKTSADNSRFCLENATMGDMEFKPSSGHLGHGLIPNASNQATKDEDYDDENGFGGMDTSSSLGRGFVPVAGLGHEKQDLDGEDDVAGSQLDYMFGEKFDGSTTYTREFVDMDAHQVMLSTLEGKIAAKKKKVSAKDRKAEIAALKVKLSELSAPEPAETKSESTTPAGSGASAVRAAKSSRRPSESGASKKPSQNRVTRREEERNVADMNEVSALPDY